MRIKNLKVSGFKSFCHPVHLQFIHNGITIVVGPNGCGKSNVVDAIRWVLGEQRPKHLRGGTMEDVIFAGSSFQKPSGMAEVTLTFSNPESDTLRQYEDYTEIAVTRRLYRSGDSVYMINKTPVRLKDVRELFMDTGIGGTGYSIIEQGRVGEIVSSRPAERRTLIDDAAGIVKFRVKRETAEKRLAETEQNLLRVTDNLSILQEQEEGLREQVERAEKFLELQEKSQNLELQHHCISWHHAGLNEQNAEKIVDQLQLQQQDLHNEKAVVETEIERLKLEQTQRAARVGERREELFKKEQQIQDSENQRVLERQNLDNIHEQQEHQKKEFAELQTRQEKLSTQEEENDILLSELEKRLSEMRILISQIEDEREEENDLLQEAKEESSNLQKRLLNVHTELTNQTNQKNFLQERLDNLFERKSKIFSQEQSNRNLLQEAMLRVVENEEETESLKMQRDELSEQMSELDLRIKDQQSLVNETERKKDDILHQQRTVQSRIESLQQIQNHYEGFSDSVKNFMQMMHDSPELQKKLGVLGLMADFVEVPADKLESASSVMGDVLDWVMIQRAENLPEIEKFCQQKELGKIQFMALDRPVTSAPVPGNADLEWTGIPFSDFLIFQPLIRGWGEAFFSYFKLQESDDVFWNQQEFGWPAAPEELISVQGTRLGHASMLIGQEKSGALGFLQRRQQIQELQATAENQQVKIEELLEEIENIREIQQTLIQQNEAKEDDLRKLEFEMVRGNKELEHNQLEVRRMEQTVSQLSQDLERIEEEMDSARGREQTATETMQSLEAERMELENNTELVQERMQVQQSRVDEIAEKLLRQRVAFTEAIEQQKNAQQTSDRLHHELEDMKKRLDFLENIRKDGQSRIESSQNKIEEIDAAFGGMLADRENLKTELEEETQLHEQKNDEQTQLNQQLQERHGHLEISVSTAHQESLKLAEFRFQREQLETQLAELSEKAPQNLINEFKQDFPDLDSVDLKKMGQDLRALKAKLSSIGSVNLAAPDEYAVLTERIEFTTTQSDDLKKAIEDLRETIKDINTESRRRFREMFQQVNEKFQQVFTSLFEGGEAKLVLTESEDLLTAGVDIAAQPPGKKLQNINLLSGGEKALTAISLIFAIFLIKPSPFCLLDEVDAPLDDANVVRFNRLINRLTDNSQFIIITHNKKTMEIGHRLYGVTMEEPGISKTVSVEFQEAQKLMI